MRQRDFGMSRMYQLITNSPQFEVFRSLSEAVRWLKWDATLLEGSFTMMRRKNLWLSRQGGNVFDRRRASCQPRRIPEASAQRNLRVVGDHNTSPPNLP